MSRALDRKSNLRTPGQRALTTVGTVALYVSSCLGPSIALAAPVVGEDGPPPARKGGDTVGGSEAPTGGLSDTDKAQALRGVAQDRFFEEDYEGALLAFSGAMELAPHSTDLFNLGRIHEEMGELAEALLRYEQFVSQPRIPLEERSAAADRIEVLRKLVKKDEPAPAVAPARPVGADSRAQREYEAERRSQTRLLSAGIAVAGLGAAIAVGGGVGFGIVARRSSDKVEDLSAGQNPGRLTLREAEDLEARGRDFETVQVAALATGGAMVTAGIVMLLVAQRRRKQTERGGAKLRAISPALSSRSLTVQARWSF